MLAEGDPDAEQGDGGQEPVPAPPACRRPHRSNRGGSERAYRKATPLPKYAIGGELPSQVPALASAASTANRGRLVAANPSSPASIQGQAQVEAANVQ